MVGSLCGELVLSTVTVSTGKKKMLFYIQKRKVWANPTSYVRAVKGSLWHIWGDSQYRQEAQIRCCIKLIETYRSYVQRVNFRAMTVKKLFFEGKGRQREGSKGRPIELGSLLVLN